MSEQPLRIAQLSNATISNDGGFLKFDIESESGPPISFEIAVDQVGSLVCYIAGAAAMGCQMLGIDSKEPDEAEAPIFGIPLRGVGFAQSHDREQFQLLLRLYGFWMSFQVESSQMAGVAERMATIAKLLATTGKPQ